MTIAENLYQNLLVFFVLFSIFIVFYCKVKNQTLGEVIKEIFKKDE